MFCGAVNVLNDCDACYGLCFFVVGFAFWIDHVLMLYLKVKMKMKMKIGTIEMKTKMLTTSYVVSSVMCDLWIYYSGHYDFFNDNDFYGDQHHVDCDDDEDVDEDVFYQNDFNLCVNDDVMFTFDDVHLHCLHFHEIFCCYRAMFCLV